MPSDPLELPNRLALRPKEAAQALGISERTLRQLLPQLPHVRAGGVILLPVAGLQEWLQVQARTGPGKVDTAVAEILQDLNE